MGEKNMFMKKLSILLLVLSGAILQAVSWNIKETVSKAVEAKASGNSKELATHCSSLASEGRLLRYRLNEKQKQQVFDACGDIFKRGTSQKTDTKNKKVDETKFKDPKAYASTAFSAPRILAAVDEEGDCGSIGKDLFSLADDDFKAGVSAGRTNLIRAVCGDYFVNNAGSGKFGEMNRSAYHKLDPTFWRTVTVDPVRFSLLAAAKNSEGSTSRGAACTLLAGDLPTKFLNDENKRLACMICGPSWEGKDVKAYENTCGALAYDEKGVSKDEEVADELPVKSTKKSKTTSSSSAFEEAAAEYATSSSSLRARLKAKYS